MRLWSEMGLTRDKVVSILVFACYVIVALLLSLGVIETRKGMSTYSPFGPAALVMFYPIFSLTLIWFPSFWSEYRSMRVTGETPAVIVYWAGWFLLVGMPALVFVVWLLTNS